MNSIRMYMQNSTKKIISNSVEKQGSKIFNGTQISYYSEISFRVTIIQLLLVKIGNKTNGILND